MRAVLQDCNLVRGFAGALAGLALIGGAATSGPAQAGFLSGGPTPAAVYRQPPAPDCGAMAARYDARRLWFGAISGTFIDRFWDRRYPYYSEGCFLSEQTCRTWLHENLSFMDGGALNWMRCRPGVPGRALR